MSDYTRPINYSLGENNAWLHRNNHNGRKAWYVAGFNEKGEFIPDRNNGYYISIGCYSRNLKWNDYEAIRNSDDSNRWQKFEEICSKMYDNKKPRYRYALWRFLFEFKMGDHILIPGNFGDFHIFKICSDVLIGYDEIKKLFPDIKEKEDEDFDYFRRIEPVRVNMSRYLLADQALASRMKIQGTTSFLNTELKQSVEIALRNEKISPYSLAMEATNEILMKSLHDSIEANKFERLIKWYFEKKGASQVKILPKNESGRQDADVQAIFSYLRLTVFVQAKKHDDTVDLPHAYEQIALYKEKNEIENTGDGMTYLYWIIYSSLKEQDFEISETDDIRVISGKEFAEMLLDVGIDKLDNAFFNEKGEKYE